MLIRRLRPDLMLLMAVLSLQAMAAPITADLQVDVEMAVRTAKIDTAHVGVSIRDGETGEEIVRINADDPMICASNMKLISTGAALHVLGHDFNFNTMMRFDGRNLVVIGDGDPAFGDPELLEKTIYRGNEGLSVNEFVNLWVDAVVAAGITEIEEVTVDARIFDDVLTHPNWPRKQLNTRSFAQVCGFNFHLNQLHMYMRSHDTGNAPPREMLRQPAYSWLDLNNEATSHCTRSRDNTGWIARPYRTNDLVMKGNVKTFGNQSVMIPVTVHDPAELFARLLAEGLRKAGVSVQTSGSAALDAPPATGEIIGPVMTTPMTTVITRCNTISQNLYAEALVKRTCHALLNKPGAWDTGTEILRHVLLERVSDSRLISDVVIDDGSGLSRANKVKPSTFTAWLHSFHVDADLGPAFIESLAEAAKTGTLDNRFHNTDLYGTRVQAKSGFVNYVSCLSGYVTAPDGDRYSFSVLVNDLHEPGSVGRAKRLQEKIVSLIAAEIGVKQAAQVGGAP